MVIIRLQLDRVFQEIEYVRNSLISFKKYADLLQKKEKQELKVLAEALKKTNERLESVVRIDEMISAQTLVSTSNKTQ